MARSALVVVLFAVCQAATLTSEQKTAIVDKHNALRAMKNANQPCTAADMEKMVWDDTLATESQTYADKCLGDHADGAGSKFGENLWMSFPGATYTTSDMTGGIQAWYDEHVDTVWNADDTQVKSKPLDQCKEKSGSTCNVGHYYQVIWAKSKKIGCGIGACASGLTVSGQSYASGVVLVCRYDPPMYQTNGATVGLPYLLGKTCAACAGQCSGGLCTSTPTRCVDKLGGTNRLNVNGKWYTSCPDLVKAHPSSMGAFAWCSGLDKVMKAEDTCLVSCKKCTVPSNMGKTHCGSGSGSSPSPNPSPSPGSSPSPNPSPPGGSPSPTTSAPVGATSSAREWRLSGPAVLFVFALSSVGAL